MASDFDFNLCFDNMFPVASFATEILENGSHTDFIIFAFCVFASYVGEIKLQLRIHFINF